MSAQNCPQNVNVVNSVWCVYLLQCADGSFYTGISMDPFQRLAIHNNGKGSKYVRSRLPAKLVYVKMIGHRGAALKEEYRIKRLSHSEKLKLVGIVIA